jgi:hypothetical protein
LTSLLYRALIDGNETSDERAEERDDEPELRRLRAILVDTHKRIEAGEDPDKAKAIAHELLDPGGD